MVSPQRTTPPASLTTKLSAVNSTPCFLFQEKSMIWCVLHLKATPRNESTDKIKAVNSRGPLLFYKHWWVSWPGFVIVFLMFLVGYFQFNSVFLCSCARPRPDFPPQLSHIGLVSTLLFPASLQLHLIRLLVPFEFKTVLFHRSLLVRLFSSIRLPCSCASVLGGQ